MNFLGNIFVAIGLISVFFFGMSLDSEYILIPCIGFLSGSIMLYIGAKLTGNIY